MGRYWILLPVAGIMVLGQSCDRFLEEAVPPGAVPASEVFSTGAKAEAAVNGIYGYMMNTSASFSSWMVSVYAGAYADELLRFNAPDNDEQFVGSDLSPDNSQVARIWLSAYKVVYLANTCLASLGQSPAVEEGQRRRLEGECYFLRAFGHYYLTRLFGSVPLIMTDDYQVNKDKGNSPAAEVYQAIDLDLAAARGLLDKGATYNRGRASWWAATTLLARVRLQANDWAGAGSLASEVLDAGPFTPLPPLQQAFLVNSREAVWQLVPDAAKQGSVPELTDAGYLPNPAPRFYLRPGLATSFERGDLRRQWWLDSVVHGGTLYHYPGKYKDASRSGKEYYVVLRAAELYLVRAEARARLGQLQEAMADLALVRQRAGLATASYDNAGALLEAILTERRHELFCEWGHRWEDLRRTGTAKAVLAPLKGPDWQATDSLWPVPQQELLVNSRLIQNEGY